MTFYGPRLVLSRTANLNIVGDTQQTFNKDVFSASATGMHTSPSGDVTVTMDGEYDLAFAAIITSNAVGYRLGWISHSALGEIAGDNKNAVNGDGTRLRATVLGFPLHQGDVLKCNLRSSQTGLQSVVAAGAFPLFSVLWRGPL